MDNDDFLKELEQITNSLDKDFNEVIKPAQIISTENKNVQEKKVSSNNITNNNANANKSSGEENSKNNNNNNNPNPFGNFANPFANFGMPFMNPNTNPEDCFKELQKLMEQDIEIDENDPEAKDMFKLLGNNTIKNFLHI